ncbi:PREDICTED: lysoplasmalogenase-like protein TMEM86A isoform X2 [Acromyrmex echinatior]|uniref:lysoplasmalogenase-like protein TMEM86A isoform X2 n=1 Tax=Acromyrmex echinatior TaxID=103372 RepID=UPI000580FED1|nr:PREDICTED: lysoplasmalogenase-like protein TMEM86A isoform X2 [Acromyrmex echinatior]
MSSPTQVIKSVGPKLVPFFKSVSVYFVLLAEQPSLLTACFKCLPIISLIIFVLLHGISLSKDYMCFDAGIKWGFSNRSANLYSITYHYGMESYIKSTILRGIVDVD